MNKKGHMGPIWKKKKNDNQNGRERIVNGREGETEREGILFIFFFSLFFLRFMKI